MYDEFYKRGLAIKIDQIQQLSEQQKEVLNLIKKWWKTEKNFKQYFVFGGCSGSGKSTLIGMIQKELGLKEWEVLNCALTGKASLVLRRKGIQAYTVHSSIYRTRKKIVDGKMQFQFYKLPSLPYSLKLIIVDQASMINKDIFNDLLSFNIPVIFVGDHQQLPPVNSEFNLMQKTDYRMQKVLRQMQGSPIIQLSMKAIKGQKISFGEYGQFVKKIHQNEITDDMLLNNQIIVGTNQKRHIINDICRQIRGFGENPQYDDKLIAIANNWQQNIFNGQIVYLTKDALPYRDTWKIQIIDELQKTEAIHACLAQSRELYATIGKNRQILQKQKFAHYVCHFNYGYAITAHNSQGSSWESVLVFDDKFGNWEKSDLYRRWLYTCITRAQEKLIIVQK